MTTFRTLIRQYQQVSGSAQYLDTLTMTNAESGENRLEDDLNYIRTQLKLITGETNWYDAPPFNFSTVTLDDVCDNGSITDQPIISQGSGSTFNSLTINTDLLIENNAFIDGDIYGTGYSSTNYILNSDGFESAIGKLDAAIGVAEVTKEIERLTSQISSGSTHTIPGSAVYTPNTGRNMEVYLNGQLLQCSLEDEERDYTEVAGVDSTDVIFTFDVPTNSYLSYIIRK